MPDTTQSTPEAPKHGSEQARSEPELTTASLANAGQTGRPAGEPSRSFASGQSAEGGRPEALFTGEETSRLRAEWDQVQASFVDEPRQAVEQADRLVATAIKRLAEIFADEKGRLEGQWDRGGDVSTEDLRLALRRYRAFFGRVLSV
jgi:hypothetical protein